MQTPLLERNAGLRGGAYSITRKKCIDVSNVVKITGFIKSI
jgi:hypothetical protein